MDFPEELVFPEENSDCFKVVHGFGPDAVALWLLLSALVFRICFDLLAKKQ